MEYPNLFRIIIPNVISPFAQPLIAMEGDSIGFPNLAMSDIGCFKGDCYCCPEDGSGNPIAVIDWVGNEFNYYTQRADSSFLVYAISINMFGGFIRNELQDISGVISTYTSGSLQGSGLPESLIFYGYAIQATNDCGSTIDFAYCYGVFCYGNMTVDCASGKIKVYTNFNFIDGQNQNPEIIEQYYNLGVVPDVYMEKNNGCGPGCFVDLKPPCLFTKNSLVYEFSGFSDIFWERYDDYGGSGYEYYVSRSDTGLSVFNKTFILPLYIADCNTAQGSIRYNLPGNILVGTGTRTYYNQLSFNGSIISSSSIVYNLEYYTNGVTANFKVIDYSLNGGPFVTCNCRGGQVYGWQSKYENQPEDSYNDPNSFTRQPICEEGVLMSRYLLYDPFIVRGISRAYYANL